MLHPFEPDSARSFTYDGSGRLVRTDQDKPGLVGFRQLHYDVDDGIVLERHQDAAGGGFWVHRFSGWQREGNQVIEAVLPMVRLINGASMRVALLEPDGHAMWTFDPTNPGGGTAEVLGVYGLPVESYGAGSSWPTDGFHGATNDRDLEVTHFGTRHAVLRDGMWMQPEPLLFLPRDHSRWQDVPGYQGELR